jgi:hypothetical protein
MSSNAYRLLGFTVWHGARWYLRRRLPHARAIAAAGLLALLGAAGAAALVKRAGG